MEKEVLILGLIDGLAFFFLTRKIFRLYKAIKKEEEETLNAFVEYICRSRI